MLIYFETLRELNLGSVKIYCPDAVMTTNRCVKVPNSESPQRIEKRKEITKPTN